jgi:hypothetical protein
MVKVPAHEVGLPPIGYGNGPCPNNGSWYLHKRHFIGSHTGLGPFSDTILGIYVSDGHENNTRLCARGIMTHLEKFGVDFNNNNGTTVDTRGPDQNTGEILLGLQTVQMIRWCNRHVSVLEVRSGQHWKPDIRKAVAAMAPGPTLVVYMNTSRASQHAGRLADAKSLMDRDLGVQSICLAIPRLWHREISLVNHTIDLTAAQKQVLHSGGDNDTLILGADVTHALNRNDPDTAPSIAAVVSSVD